MVVYALISQFERMSETGCLTETRVEPLFCHSRKNGIHTLCQYSVKMGFRVYVFIPKKMEFSLSIVIPIKW